MKLTLKIREPEHGFGVRPEHKLYQVERVNDEVIDHYVGSTVPRLQGELKSIIFACFVEFERVAKGIEISMARGNREFAEKLERRIDQALHDVIPYGRGEISFVAFESNNHNYRIS